MIDALWVLAFAIPAYFLQTLLHEASHAFVAIRQSWVVTSFKIWPHKAENERFYWGRVTYQKSPSTIDLPEEAAARSWAPFLSGVVVWLVLSVSTLWLGELRWWGWALLTYYGAVTIDLLRGLLQPFWRKERGDANKGAAALGLSRSALKLMCGPVALLILGGSAALLLKVFT